MAHQTVIQAILHADNGIPKDATVNTWHFDGGVVGATPEDALNDAMDRLTNFYQTIDTWLASTLSGVVTFKGYNLADASPRPALVVRDIAIVPNASTHLPSEVALVLSFRAAYEAGVNRARRRGRIFVGPIGGDHTHIDAGMHRPEPDCVDAIVGAATALLAASDADAAWAVFSPTARNAGASLADSTNDVVAGWVDNGWDTQRRRGAVATERTTFGA